MKTASCLARLIETTSTGHSVFALPEVEGFAQVQAFIERIRQIPSRAQRQYFFENITQTIYEIFVLEMVLPAILNHKKETIDGWLNNRIKKETENLCHMAEGYSVNFYGPMIRETLIMDESKEYSSDNLFFSRPEIRVYNSKTVEELKKDIPEQIESRKKHLTKLEKALFNLEKIEEAHRIYLEKIEAAKNEYKNSYKEICGKEFVSIPGLEIR